MDEPEYTRSYIAEKETGYKYPEDNRDLWISPLLTSKHIGKL